MTPHATRLPASPVLIGIWSELAIPPLGMLSAPAWMMIAVFWPVVRSSSVKASVVVTNIPTPSLRTCSTLKSPLGGWAAWPGAWKCSPAERKSPDAPPLGPTEFGSHLPTLWMCTPWNPGASRPSPLVAMVTVAYPLLKSNFAVATWVPSGVRRWVLRLGTGSAASVPDAPAGAGEPRQISGLVPGTDDACWGDEHALTNAAENAKKDAKKEEEATVTLR